MSTRFCYGEMVVEKIYLLIVMRQSGSSEEKLDLNYSGWKTATERESEDMDMLTTTSLMDGFLG